MQDSLRCLYVCYLSLVDPLVHSQVVAYLAGLASRGHTVHLLTFDGPLSPAQREGFRRDLARLGITWHSRRYHKRPSLPATIYDTLVGAWAVLRIAKKHRLDAIHARNHVPAAMALMARRLSPRRFIFDLRGLMAEEYVDTGSWRRGSAPYRITESVQREGLRRADGIVVLTEAVRDYLFDGQGVDRNLEVIPCCTGLSGTMAEAPYAIRAQLALGDRPVMVYVGKFGGWYMGREMVEFFRAAQSIEPALVFLVVTQSDPDLIEAELRAAGVADADYRITSAGPGEIGGFLAAGTFGVSFVRSTHSKISSSPTKIGEYLAAGLPVVSTSGIGDVDALLSCDGVGVLLASPTAERYGAAAREILSLAGASAPPARSREVAQSRLSLDGVGIPRYDRLYRRVAAASPR